MITKSSLRYLQFGVAVAFIAMVVINYLSQALPINGVSPAQVSDSLPNLFAPAGLTFSIWGVIYLLLALFTVFQFGFSIKTPNAAQLDHVRKFFILSSLANIAWIFSWHYGVIWLSMGLMLVLLLSLIDINHRLDAMMLTRTERFLFRLPFRLYFGWITVATVANATALLVWLGWNRFGLSEGIWMIIITIIGMGIGTLTTLLRKDIAYGLVLIWAYVGILIRHQSASGFAGAYPMVIATVIACLVIFSIATGTLIVKLVKGNKQTA